MIFDYDSYGKLKQNKVFLANPQKNYVDMLFGVKSLNFKRKCMDISEAHFTVYREENGKVNKLYDELEAKRLIEIQYVGWFQIHEAKIKDDGLVSYKEIKCLSLENELIGKRIADINGVYALYDITDHENSLLHIITEYCDWKIGHVDNELIGKWRTFSVDSEQIYNLLTTTISKSFDCIFQFNTFDKTINVYKEGNLGNLTDIFITHKNLLKEHLIECDADNIVTRLKVQGADGVDIREVNPTGRVDIINVDYYKKWMSPELVTSYNLYQNAYNNVILEHTSVINTYKAKQLELNTLKAELRTLELSRNAEQEVIDSYLNTYNGIPPYPEYSIFLNALNEQASLVSQVVIKNDEIIAKENEITVVKNALISISNDLDQSKYFSPEQLSELNSFLIETTEYQDSTFVITDTMSDDEATEVRLELFSNGLSELQRISKPQYEFSITAKNLYTLSSNGKSVSYEKWKEQLDVGNFVTIPFSNDLYTTVRLLEMDFDFDKSDDINLTLSNKDRYDNTGSLAEMIANANRKSNSLSLKEFGYDQASKLSSPVREFINSALDATNNALQSNDNQELLISKYGLWLRKWLDDQNKYSDEQAKWVNNVLLFSDDGFKSAKTGIGKFITPDGDSFYGFMGEVIFGDLVASSALTIRNQNNSFIVDKDGAFLENAEFIIYRGGNTIKLNPTDGFTILNGTTKTIWLGSDGNAYFSGKITSSEIETSKFTATNGVNTLVIDPNSSSIFKVSKYGLDKIWFNSDGDANFSGKITSSEIETSKFTAKNDLNEIIIDPNNDGSLFTISRAGMPQIYFDSDGNAVFNGHMTIGVIYSENWLSSGGNEDGSELGTEGTFIDLRNGNFYFGGEHLKLTEDYIRVTGEGSYTWMNRTTGEAEFYTHIQDGKIALRHMELGYDLNITPNGIATTLTANDDSTGIIDFYSKVYGESFVGLTLQTLGSPLGVRSKQNAVLINPHATLAGNDTSLFRFSHSGNSGAINFGQLSDSGFTGFSGIKFSGDGDDSLITILSSADGSLGNLKCKNIENEKIVTNIIEASNSIKVNGINIATKTDLDSLETEWQALLQTSYNNGYSVGQTAGYNTGYNIGQSNGYSSGYSSGYSDGYSAGSSSGN